MPTTPPSALDAVPLLGQVDADPLLTACGEDPGPFCTWVFERTDIVWLSALAGRVIPTILEIILIFAIAAVATRLVKRAVKRFISSLQNQGIEKLSALRSKSVLAATHPIDVARATMRTETIGSVLRSVAVFMIWTIAIVMALGAVNINLGPLIAGAGIAGIALGFGAQNLVKDFLSGMFMLLEDQYGVGDIVDVGEASGVVETISLRTTRLRDVEGVVWYVPNGEIRRVGNMSQEWSRALLDVGVAYDTDIPRAKEVIKRVADELWQDPEMGQLILDEPDVWGVENFGPDEIIIRLVVKTAPQEQWGVARELRARLKRAFDAEGIEIPFPQRTVWMHQVDGDDRSRRAADGSEPAAATSVARESAPREPASPMHGGGARADDDPTRRRGDSDWLPPSTP